MPLLSLINRHHIYEIPLPVTEYVIRMTQGSDGVSLNKDVVVGDVLTIKFKHTERYTIFRSVMYSADNASFRIFMNPQGRIFTAQCSTTSLKADGIDLAIATQIDNGFIGQIIEAEFIVTVDSNIRFICGGSVASLKGAELYEFSLAGEQFDCNEGTGLTTTGSQGTVGTINRESMWKNPLTQYFLDLDSTQDDYLNILQSEKKWQVPVITGTFEFGITIDVPLVAPPSDAGLIGYLKQGGYNDAWGLLFSENPSSGNQELCFEVVGFPSSTWLFYSDLINLYGGEKVTIKAGYYDTSPTNRMYVNGVLVASGDNGRPYYLNANVLFTIGATSRNAGTIFDHFNGAVHSFFVDGQEWDCNEGSGNVTNSEVGGYQADLFTSSLDPNYFDDFMWQPLIPHFLDLDRTQEDYASITNAELDTNVPSTGDFEYGGVFTIPTSTGGNINGMLGRTAATGSTNRWGIYILSTGELVFDFFFVKSVAVANFTATYGGQTIKISAKYEGLEGIGYINDVEVGRVTLIQRPPANLQTFFIGVYADATGLGPSAGRYFNGQIHSFFIGDNEWEVNEGSGIFTTSKVGGYQANLFTSNLSPTYIDDFMWQPIVPQYILDFYPNAASAYSLRQLKNGVTNVVRVRRSSDNTEQDFTPSGITNGTLTTFTGAGNGFVSVWYDQSGNGVNSFNTTANEQPKIVSNGALILEGGVPSLLFSGGQQLDTGAVTISSEDYSFFGVAKCSTSGSETIVRCRDLGASGSVEGLTFYELFSGVTSNLSIDNGNGDSLIPSLSDAVSQVNHLISTLYTTNTGDFYVDTSKVGTQFVASGSLPIGNVALPYINIGGERYNRGLDGTIQEIIIYDNNKQYERGNIEADINDYYTIF